MESGADLRMAFDRSIDHGLSGSPEVPCASEGTLERRSRASYAFLGKASWSMDRPRFSRAGTFNSLLRRVARPGQCFLRLSAYSMASLICRWKLCKCAREEQSQLQKYETGFAPAIQGEKKQKRGNGDDHRQ